jgi:F-type H+-transporting ATPase subunit delta
MSQISNRYAKALFDTVQEQNDLEAVQAALTDIASLIIDLKDFRLFLSNPVLSLEERGAVLKALFEGKIPDVAYRFLLFIVHKNRLNILQDIIASFDGLYLSGTSQLRAFVKTAFPVAEEDQAIINGHLQDKFHQRMITQWNLDPDLLGGFCIYVGGRVYDYSFKSQLNNFIQQMV